MVVCRAPVGTNCLMGAGHGRRVIGARIRVRVTRKLAVVWVVLEDFVSKVERPAIDVDKMWARDWDRGRRGERLKKEMLQGNISVVGIGHRHRHFVKCLNIPWNAGKDRNLRKNKHRYRECMKIPGISLNAW